MQKLKSIESFENEILESAKMLNVLGGKKGEPVSQLSTRYMTINTMTLYNCTDQNGRVDTDQNGGAWSLGQENSICEQTETDAPCYN